MFTLITDEVKELATKALDNALAQGFDKQATIKVVLAAVKEEIAKNARFNVYKDLDACPSCKGNTVEPGLVHEYFTCTNEWHMVKGIVNSIMTVVAV